MSSRRGAEAGAGVYVLAPVIALLAVHALVLLSSRWLAGWDEWPATVWSYAGIGVTVLALSAAIDYHTYERHGWALLLVALAGFTLQLTPLAVEGSLPTLVRAGPLTLTPSSLLTGVLLVWFCAVAAGQEICISGIRQWSPYFGLGGIVSLLAVQPDFGAAAVFLLTAVCVLYARGANALTLGTVLGLWVVGGCAVLASHPFFLHKISVLLDPYSDPWGAGWSTVQSFAALRAGGVTGVGFGQGTLKASIPLVHSDYAISLVGEEFGLLGVITVAALVGSLTATGLRLATRARTPYEGALPLAIGAYFGLGLLMHLGVAAGVFPAVGVRLPLVSWSPSTMFSDLFLAGVMLNIARSAPAGSLVPRGPGRAWSRLRQRLGALPARVAAHPAYRYLEITTVAWAFYMIISQAWRYFTHR